MSNIVHPPIAAVRETVTRALAEDIGPLGDLTASLVPEGTRARAAFVARQEGVIAGCRCVSETFSQIDPTTKLDWTADDGAEVRPGEVLGRVDGSLASILTAERTALNFLCHLSGVATFTRRFVRATHGRSRIWDTRKTTPGLRALEKAAVRAGGGVNHRGSLSDFVLVKDNHLSGLTITEAVTAGATMLLLDNMTPEKVAEAVGMIRGRAVIEVSGGVTLDNVGAYAAAGAHLISSGAITSSAPNLDIGLDLET